MTRIGRQAYQIENKPEDGHDYVCPTVDVLRQHADYVILDAPPVMAVADARLIGRFVDKTLFVVRWNKTPNAMVSSALEQMRAGGLDIAGVVLQHVNLQRYGNIEFSDFGYLYHQER